MDRESYLRELAESQPQLRGLIKRLHYHFHDHDDILQEANVYIIEKYPEFDDSKVFLPWAYSLTRWAVLRYRKTLSRQFENLVFDSDSLGRLLEVGAQYHKDLPYDVEVERLDLMEKIKKTLGPKELLVFNAYLEGMPVEEICSEHGLKRCAVYALYRRSKKKAREFLQEYKELKRQ